MPDRVRETTGNGPDRELFDDVLAAHTELKTAMARLAQKMKTNLGRYEAAGGEPDEIKFAHRLLKLDKGEALARVRQMTRAAMWAGIVSYDPDTGQGDFTKGLDGPPPKDGAPPGSRLALARAYSDGYNSGKHGATIDSSPYNHAPGSEEFVKWRDGWSDGSEDRGERGGSVNTSKERPARRNAAANGEDAADNPPDEPEDGANETAGSHAAGRVRAASAGRKKAAGGGRKRSSTADAAVH